MLDKIEGETVIWEGHDTSDPRRRISTMAITLFAILIIAGLATIVFHGIGIIFLVLAGIYLYFLIKRRGPQMLFALTATRAIIVERKGGGVINILQQCNLNETTVSVMNRTTETNVFKAPIGAQRPVSGTHEMGDILFFGNGQLKLRFNAIRNPNDVLELLKATAKQEITAPNATLTGTMEPIDEKELWNYGPIVVTLQFGEIKDEHSWKDALHAKTVKVRYGLTPTRAYIIGAGGEGKIQYFNYADFYKTAYNISHPKVGTKKISVMKGWKGGLIAQCYLAESQVVVTNRTQTTTVGSENVKPSGDINFIVGGKIAFTFERVDDPDGVIALIEHALKQQI